MQQSIYIYIYFATALNTIARIIKDPNYSLYRSNYSSVHSNTQKRLQTVLLQVVEIFYLESTVSGISHNRVKRLSKSKGSLCANGSPQIFPLCMLPNGACMGLPVGCKLVAFPQVIALMWSRSCRFWISVWKGWSEYALLFCCQGEREREWEEKEKQTWRLFLWPCCSWLGRL